jgi:hypothetical protein
MLSEKTESLKEGIEVFIRSRLSELLNATLIDTDQIGFRIFR